MGVNLYIELNQMFSINVGIEIKNDNNLGFRGSLGASPFDIKTISYSAVLFYKLPENFTNFDYSVELGIPIAYFDLFEGKYVDWDPIIDNPYAGWLLGVTIKTEFFRHWLLKTGVAYWIEWQEDEGFKNGVLPIVSLGYKF